MGKPAARISNMHVCPEVNMGIYVDKWGNNKKFGISRRLAQHSIDNMFKAMAKIPWTQDDLGWDKEDYYYS